ncbi:hypothetical protein ONZ45_g704 [Pleurotus djamor]|nr:hypothetical protein ONZ45_g704 [Pleurotus djamor]
MDMFYELPRNATSTPLTWPPNEFSFTPNDIPFYFSHRLPLFDNVSDEALTLAAPILAYWAISLFFHYLDMSGWKWLEKYRIHESAEVQAKNTATRSQVVQAVILQQLIQTGLGIIWLSEPRAAPNHVLELDSLARKLYSFANFALGDEVGQVVYKSYGKAIVYLTYWWAIPIFQFLCAIVFIDTWQYFLHRAMHVNTFLFRHFHSWHHRLYVPYAFGALYNHPVEGFLLDSLGAALAEAATGMSTRQALVLFTLSTFKTVDDHCGYRLPFDPLQMLTSNNADYHDIHHQLIGIKSNFSQPFFIHWDTLLGTRMTREEMMRLKSKQRKTQ